MSAERRSLLAGIIALVILLGAGLVWINRQHIQDWVVVGQYEVGSEVATIVERAGFSDYGEFLFYANKPEISNAEVFNRQCQRRELGAAILGCYTSGHIFIYRVNNPELDGVKEVTAAHELLHSAWRRLSAREREQLIPQLEKVYERIKTPQLEERMRYYERQQPGEHYNELHSIVGTEVPRLTSELEDHYRHYFDDRQAVVRLHQGYESLFIELRESETRLVATLEGLAEDINRDVARYNREVERLNQNILTHNQALSALDRSNASQVAAYNARRAVLQQEQSSLQELRSSIDERKVEYNKRLEEYNDLAVRSYRLNGSIDSYEKSIKPNSSEE